MTNAIIAGVLGIMAAFSHAQDRPGIDRPIRVGSFLGTGSGRFWSTNVQTANTALGTLLANPDSAGLGPHLIVPPRGFSFTKFGVVCQNCSPTEDQTAVFIQALDTLDVVYIGSFADLGGIIRDPRQREKLRTFITTKAFLSVGRTTDTFGTWPFLDSLHGTRLQNHASDSRFATLRRDSVADTTADWQYLNRGLFQNGLDTVHFEWWFSWTASGEAIRAGNALGSLFITTKLLEETMTRGMGGARVMGDHPMSWGRRMAAGGRVFYTGLGHHAQAYAGRPGENSRLLRRHLYNAILWVAKYDSLAPPQPSAAPPAAAARARESARVTASPSVLKVTLLREGSHSVELLGLDGGRVAHRRGQGSVGTGHVFRGLRAGVYVLAVVTRQGRTTCLVTVP